MGWHSLNHSADEHMGVAGAHVVEYRCFEEIRDMELVGGFGIASSVAYQALDAVMSLSCLPEVVVSSRVPQSWSDIRDC